MADSRAPWWTTAARSARREAARLRARPWDLAMISWVPLLACLLIWWIFSAGLATRLPIGLIDDDHTSLSRQLGRWLDADPGLHIVQRYDDPVAAERAMRRGDVAAVVWVPATFTRDVKRGQAASVHLWHNAQWGTHSGLIQRDVRTVVATLSAGVELAARQKRGETGVAARWALEPLRTAAQTQFNPTVNNEWFLAAALVPALLHILAMTAGAWAVGVELRDGTVATWLEQDAGAGEAGGALAGKLLWPGLGLGAVASIMLVWLAAGRGWRVTGSAPGLWGAWMVFLGLSVLMGAWVATLTRSLRTALSVTGFVTAPAFAFSGVGFPLLAMPDGARWWAQCLPFTHLARLQIEQWVMGAPWPVSVPVVVWMAVAALGLMFWSAHALAGVRRRPETWGRR